MRHNGHAALVPVFDIKRAGGGERYVVGHVEQSDGVRAEHGHPARGRQQRFLPDHTVTAGFSKPAGKDDCRPGTYRCQGADAGFGMGRPDQDHRDVRWAGQTLDIGVAPYAADFFCSRVYGPDIAIEPVLDEKMKRPSADLCGVRRRADQRDAARSEQAFKVRGSHVRTLGGRGTH